MDEQRKRKTLCPICGVGWGVPVDEDGCCTTCGACAFGDGVDTVAREIAALREELRIARLSLTDHEEAIEALNDEANVQTSKIVALREEVEMWQAEYEKLVGWGAKTPAEQMVIDSARAWWGGYVPATHGHATRERALREAVAAMEAENDANTVD